MSAPAPQSPEGQKEVKRHSIGLVTTDQGFEGARTEDGMIRQGITGATNDMVIEAIAKMLPSLKTLAAGTQVGINVTIEKP